jgi:hypothetical protein
LGCWTYGSLSKSDEAEDYYINATVSFSHDGATGAGFTLAPNVRGWVN